MHQIKTYDQVDVHHAGITFRISRMEDIHDAHGGIKDDPHRHDYYTLLLVKEANGIHVVDFKEFPLASHQIWFISPGQVHQVIEEKKSFGYAVLFSEEFLVQNHIPPHFIGDLQLFNDFGHSPPLNISPEEFDTLSGYCEQMITLRDTSQKFREQALSSYLTLFLIQSNNLCSLDGGLPQSQESGNMILRRFRELVNQRHNRWHQTSDYARELNVSPDHLNRVVKSMVGKTAKDYIQSCILLDAKRMLYFSGLSAKEIGYELGFSEPANFSAFFKKHTGVAPSHYREND
jgi:AraC-like DNA-binding protein